MAFNRNKNIEIAVHPRRCSPKIAFESFLHEFLSISYHINIDDSNSKKKICIEKWNGKNENNEAF